MRTRFRARVIAVSLWHCSVLPVFAGCVGAGTFAFYEDSKVAIAISADPSAPDPVEITAAYKESVFGLVPLRLKPSNSGAGNGSTPHYDVGSVLSDFDVRYGANDSSKGTLFASVNHGLATGTAARTLAGRVTGDLAHKIVIAQFVRSLDDAQTKEAAEILGLSGLGTQATSTVRNRLLMAVQQAEPDVLTQIENALKGKFPAFKPWTP